MDNNSFFSIHDLSTNVEKFNQLTIGTFRLLAKVFTVASLVIWAVSPLVCLFDRVSGAARDIFCLLAFFSLLILLVGYRNLKHWHFPLLAVFAAAFGGFTCLFAGPYVLCFTVPSALVCCLVLLLNKVQRQATIGLICSVVVLFTVALIFAILPPMANGLFLAATSSIHLMLFFVLMAFDLKVISRKNLPADWYMATNKNVVFLIIGHCLLANLILIAGFIIAG